MSVSHLCRLQQPLLLANYMESKTHCCIQPERIQGGAYSVKSDVWSLGISLIELALGRFPFMDDDSNGLDSDNDSDLEEMRRTITGRDDAASGRKVVEKRDPGELRKKQETKTKAAKAAHANGGGNGGGVNMSILDLLQHIVNEPAPRLVPPGKYGHDAEHFVQDCLQKDPKDRKNPKELLVSQVDRDHLAHALSTHSCILLCMCV